MTLQKQTSLFTEDQLTSSQEDSHVNHTQWQEKDLEKKMNAIYGQKCLEQYEKFNRHGSWAKMFSDLLIGMEGWYSTRCKLTWKLKGTKFNRMYFQLQASTLHTEGTGFGLLLTPNLVQIAETPEKYQERQKKRTENGFNQAPHPNNKYNCLLSQVLYSGMLPTPAASNYKGASSTEDLKARGRFKEKEDNLADQFSQDGKSSQLNPRFVMEMMGFPTDWTELPFLNGETNQ